jgi:signal transduction histidine kinase
MFYRAEQYLTQAVAGTGLGLALVRTIVRAHGGSVRIETGDGGKGTLFRLRFPLTREPLPAAAPAARREAAAEPTEAKA